MMKKFELNANSASFAVVLGGCVSTAVFVMHLFSTLSIKLTFVLAMSYVLMVLFAICYGYSSRGKSLLRFVDQLWMFAGGFALGFLVAMSRGNLTLVDALPDLSLAYLSIAGFVEIGRLYAEWSKPVELECNLANA
nr:hypothetical protein pJBCL41_00024 [Pseudomonas sp.]